jgi:hypothetical protein
MSFLHGSFRSQQSGFRTARRRLLLLIGAQLGVLACAQAACIDRATLVKSAVSVYRDFNAQERKLRPGILGIAGTGWFLSPRLLVTAAHVAEAMPLASTEWKDIEICNGKAKTVVPSRIHSLAGHLSERMTLLDVLVPVAGADALAVRREPLLAQEQMVARAYPMRHLRERQCWTARGESWPSSVRS